MTILCLCPEQHHWKLIPGYADALRRRGIEFFCADDSIPFDAPLEDVLQTCLGTPSAIFHFGSAHPFMTLTAPARAEKTPRNSFRYPRGWQRPSANRRARSESALLSFVDQVDAVTGVPVIMNTSFNLRGKAIMHTPTDALRTFFGSGMDTLVVGSFLVDK